ncbi:SRPBCC family protein [Streptomyces sp. NBC_01498]|uniref:SRPBCC family protein n=1 Tax=Streptomyces sp. NBC_01498 TaxID=2975870 RepID=UPI002E7C1FEA|nr:SRPBCC family protein [Streptomyces sp. NBC_01498]WTL27676.1 SRPBCC family protein [Streptomyces sp. NBC_01498]
MTSTQEDTDTSAPSNVERLRAEITHYAGAQLDRVVDRVGGKLTDVTGKLTDIAENGGQLPAIGSRILHGESPIRSVVSEKAKSVKDSVTDKAKDLTGAGGKPGSGDVKVTNIVEVLDVGVPLRTAYDHWTAYDKFAGFTKGVGNVSKDKDDETTSNWTAKVGPSSRSFKATVLEQIPDDRIVWESEGSKGTTQGAISFHEMAPNLTRIVLVVEYSPAGFFEKTGNIWRAQGRRLRLDFKNFQRYVTLTDEEPEAWRGEIRDGEVVRTHEEVMEEEENQHEEEDQDPEDDEGEETEPDEDGDEDTERE